MVYPVGRDNRFLEGKSIYYGLPGKGKGCTVSIL